MKPPNGVYPGEYTGTKRDIMYQATGEYRRPRKGEHYLSGAVITAYVAPNELGAPYWIAIAVEMVPCDHCGGTGRIIAPSRINKTEEQRED
jgi:hypothetical protein